jgi:lysophospholipase L1-like esterase
MSSLISVFSENQFKPMASESYVDKKVQEAISSSALPSFYGYTDKPFNFAGKTIYFFGDSICEGHTGHGITQNNYVNLFKNKVGCTAVNRGQGGACFSYTYNGVPSIVDRIKATTLTDADAIIIEGGINDWQTNATSTQLETALSDLATWLSSNYSGKVVVITPINTTWSRSVNMTVPQVRKIMEKWAVKNGYSLILGEQFNFPSETGVLSEILLGDGLHPSEAGYELFAKNLVYALVGSEGIPMCPTSTDGTYTLQCVVSSGTPTYSWVAQSS